MSMAKQSKKYQSFANRLTRNVLLAVLAIMVVTLMISLISAFRAMKAETYGRYLGIMNVVSEKVGRILKTEEMGTMIVCDEVEHHLDSPETIMAALRESNIEGSIEGYFAAFEPDYYPQKGKWFEPYIHLVNGEEVMSEVGSEKHDYLNADWYIRVKKEEKGFWTDPYEYVDEAGNSHAFCTYVLPIHDMDGRFVGACGADMSLEWLVSDLKQIIATSRDEGMKDIDDKYNNLDFYSFVINHDGTYIAHPLEKRVLKENVLSYIKGTDSQEYDRVVSIMKQGLSGFASVTVDGTWSTVYFAPLECTQWWLVTIVSKRAISRPVVLLALSLIGATIFGLLVIWFICRRSIPKATKPLTALAHSADEVAKGHFDTPLPELEFNDEISQLRNSFETMQHSLVNYIEELKNTTALKERMESELRIARDIQMSMVPAKFPKREGLDMYAMMEPAKEVGGDLYGYLLHGDYLYFCVGDVSGKGVPASLFMAQATRLFRTLAAQDMKPAEILIHINDALSGDDNKKSMFVTLFLGLLNLNTGHLDFCNAGHNAPVIGGGDSRGEFLVIKPNCPVGLMPGFQFRGEEIDTIKGRPLFIYTDGLNEAENQERQQLGNDRMLDILRQTNVENAQQVIETLKQEVENHRNGAEPNDDLTMMVVHLK